MPKTEKNTVCEAVKKLAEPLAEALGLKIWSVKFLKEGPNWYLRVFIDKNEGITIDDCEKMSRALDAPLDELDPIQESYFLEVCSPGIDRELTEKEHFEKFMGSAVKIKLIRPGENKEKEIEGKLLKFDKDKITLETENSIVEIERKNISHVNLKF